MIRAVIFFLVFGCSLFPYSIQCEGPKTKHLGYGDWFIKSDGEWDLMKEILSPKDVVFDVGANVGEWSLYALKTQPSIELYAFEPVPLIFSELTDKLRGFSHARAFPFALSDENGQDRFYHYDETHDFSALSSFFVREVLKKDHQPPKVIEVEKKTLSTFCAEHAIDRIDFLKIDAEGAEWIILKGAADLIDREAIKAIQFEYGGCNIDSKTTLRDIYDFLASRDYLIFRIKPKGLIFIPKWHEHLENYELSNYFAIKKGVWEKIFSQKLRLAKSING